MSNFIADPFTSSSIVYLSLNELLLIVPVRINLSNMHCGSCQLLQSDIIHPPSHIFPLVIPSGLASVNHASQTPHAFCCSQSCDTVHSSFPLQCEGSQLGHNCPPTTLSLNLVLPFVYQILTSFLSELLAMFLSFVYSSSHKSGVGMWLGHAQSLLHYFVPQESWAGLMCSWTSSSWMTGRKQRRVSVAQKTESARVCGDAEDRPRGQHSRAHPRLWARNRQNPSPETEPPETSLTASTAFCISD